MKSFLVKFSLVFNTVRRLKFQQVYFQIYNRIKFKTYIKELNLSLSSSKLDFDYKIYHELKYLRKNHFRFLNQEKFFENNIDWNFFTYGKLWNYNLEYFDFLHQNDISLDEKKRLLLDFYKFSIIKRRKLEPYPVSLRGINVIRFLIENNYYDKEILSYLYQELSFLYKNFEYHLLGNHLLENAFSMIMGGMFFSQEKWIKYGKKVLWRELEEQILRDGAHFELSPMYHNIILYRLLELIDWYKKIEGTDQLFLSFCKAKASLMLTWIENICFDNSDIPLFNDAAKGVAFNISSIRNYANLLGIKRNQSIKLQESGYRSFKNQYFEMKVDVASIGSKYQPGHAHADALSFLVYYKNLPLLIEQGTSTYSAGKRRKIERSTNAHNSVMVNGVDQSEMWDIFKVGKAAKTTILEEFDNMITASHDGYKSQGIIHSRTFKFEDKRIEITDNIISEKKQNALALFHFAPNVDVSIKENHLVLINGEILCLFKGFIDIQKEEYEYSDSFNTYIKSNRILVKFDSTLTTTIILNSYIL